MIFGRARKKQLPTNPKRDVPVGLVRRHELEAAIPMGVEIAGQWAWRLLAVTAVIVVFAFAISQLRDIVIPLLIALLLTSLLNPLVNLLSRHGWKRGLAVALTMVVTIAVVTGLIFLVVAQIRSGSEGLGDRSVAAYNDFKNFLATGPLQISDTDFNNYIDQAIKSIQSDSGVLVTGALSVGTSTLHILTGLLLVLFSTLFMLLDGKRIWSWIVRIFPRKARNSLAGAGRAGWVTLATFVKVQIFVAFVDAVGIGLGAFIIGLFYGGFPLVIPIAILVFLASFIPVVGAVVTGIVAVLVALVYLGPFPALLMLAVVLLVQQVEGHVLQPLVMGTAVRVHPLAVVLSVAAASFIAGIPGALFAVPFVAVLNVMVKYIGSGAWRTDPHPQIDDLEDTTGVVQRQ